MLTTPTTAMNRAGSGLRNDALDHRMEFFDPKTRPVALFWDAEALLTALPSLARSTGTTTFTGCLHRIAASPANPLVEGDHRQAFRLASRALPRLAAEPDNAAPRIDLCAAAFLQNRADADGAAREGRDRVSSAAYALATALHIRYDHVGQGEATSAVTPAVLRRLGGSRGDGGRRMAEALGVATAGMAPDTAGPAAAQALEAFYRGIDMPARVRDLGIPEAELPLVARDTLKNFNANRGARPADYVDQMLAFDLPFPPARNPWNTRHHPGGSSSGSGAALAAGLVPLALGTDTGGSVRNPAGACGVVGLKPTYGLVSRRGVFPLAFTLDHVGPMARSVADIALLLDTLAGHDPADPGSVATASRRFGADLDRGLHGLRIGFVRHFHETDMPADPEIAAALEEAARVLEAEGAHVRTVTLPSLRDFSGAQRVIMLAESWAIHARWLRERPGD